MKDKNNLSSDDFENLLDWFSPDREQAGEIYEKIRQGLMRFFRHRGCSEVDVLADETFNRVAGKVADYNADENSKTIGYIYGFAAKIAVEYHLRRKKREIPLAENVHSIENDFERFENFEPKKHQCLKNCLRKLSDIDSEMILEYFQEVGHMRIESRKIMAKKNNLTIAGLHIKIHRLRKNLKSCIEKCLKKKL